MKKLDVSSITDTSQMPVKQGTLQFLQDSYYEIVQAVMSALVGPGYDPSVIYVLYGVFNSGTYPGYSISAGAVFYNGEIFLVDAAAFSATGTNVGVFSIITSQYTVNADPVTFTDSAVRSIHNIRKIQVTQGASGSGIADFGQAYYLNFVIPSQLELSAPIVAPYANNILQIIGAYPNLGLYVPQPAATANPILYAGSYNVGDPVGGGGTPGSDYAVNFPTALATASYYVVGTLISNGADAGVDTTCVFTVRARTTTGFTLHVREFVSPSAQNLAFEYIIFQK